MLEDGPQQIRARGSNGVDAWWEFYVERKTTTPTYHEGLDPNTAQMIFNDWIANFSRSGDRALEAVRNGEAQHVGEEERSPFGKLLIIRSTIPQNGVVRTRAVRAEEPHVVAEWTDVDSEAKKVQSVRLTHWEWFDTKQIPDSFWLTSRTLDVSDTR
jgi:hypothetical protein